MITKKLLKSYRRYDGDLDAWSRSLFAKKEQYKDWYLIGSILQDLKLLNNNMASEDYRKLVEEKLKENCDSQETIDELLSMSIT